MFSVLNVFSVFSDTVKRLKVFLCPMLSYNRKNIVVFESYQASLASLL